MIEAPMEVRGALDVFQERFRQIYSEGWTEQHDDDEHYQGGLVDAAICYAREPFWREDESRLEVPDDWPWDAKWWKPKDRRRDLVRAAALLIAEIDRLDRAPSND